MKGTRPLSGPALTNDLCGQYVKNRIDFGFGFRLNKQVRRDKHVG